MPNFRRFLSRRWLLTVLAIAALLFGLAMLHPYPRQSLFGPTIRGKPRCFWEAELRSVVQPEPISETVRRCLGLKSSRMPLDELFDHPDMLPLVLELLDDPERHVREHALARINLHGSLQDRSALPALHKRLDDDLNNRLHAAQAIWRIDRDHQALALIMALMKDKEPATRLRAVNHAASLPNTPELFPRLADHAKDQEPQVREAVMWGLRHHGKHGMPILMDGLNDKEPRVRLNAVQTLGFLKRDATDAVPALQWRVKDPDPEVRREALAALTTIARAPK